MKTIFAKYNSERLPKYQIVTKIVEDENKNRFALKQAMSQEAHEHIDEIFSNYELLTARYSINLVKPHKIEDGILFEMAKGRSLESLLLECIENNDKESFTKYINKFLDFVDGMVNKRGVVFEPCEEFTAIFGEWENSEPQDIIEIANIDLIFGNIFVENDKFTLIDYEWVFDFDIPKSYVVWRSLAIFSAYHSVNLDKFTDINNEAFLRLDNSFSNFVHGKDRKYLLSSKVGKQVNGINLGNKATTIHSDYSIQLFIEDENGISEENSIKFPLEQNDETQEFEFDLNDRKNIKLLRVDPLNDYCIIKINSILLDEVIVNTIQSNACHVEGNIYYFNTNDPQMYVDIADVKAVEKFTIDLEYLHIGADALNHVVNDLLKAFTSKEQNIQSLNAELVGVYMSKSWKITRPLRSLVRKFKRTNR